MPETLLVVGVLAQVVVSRLVALDRLRFWPATAATFAVLGLASLVIGDPSCCGATTVPIALGAGTGSALALYAATRVVIGLGTRQPGLRAAVAGIYRRSEETGFTAALVISLAIAAPGEELFWRGLVVPELRAATASVAGGVLAWLGYVGVNAASVSLPLLAGAIVGGAVWTWLALWSHGVLAPIASHVVWTGLMLTWPPPVGRGKVRP